MSRRGLNYFDQHETACGHRKRRLTIFKLTYSQRALPHASDVSAISRSEILRQVLALAKRCRTVSRQFFARPKQGSAAINKHTVRRGAHSVSWLAGSGLAPDSLRSEPDLCALSRGFPSVALASESYGNAFSRAFRRFNALTSASALAITISLCAP